MGRFDILLLLSKCIFTVVQSGDNCWLLVTATKSYASQFINVMKKTWIRSMCPHCRWSATRPPRGSQQRTSSSASGSRVWSSSSRTNSGWAAWAGWGTGSASKSSIQMFVITEKAPTRAFSWLKAATTAFTFLNVKLGPRHNYHKGRAAWLA